MVNFQEFFAVTENLHAKMQSLNEIVIRLLAHTDDQTSADIKNKHKVLENTWQDIIQRAKLSKSTAVQADRQKLRDSVKEMMYELANIQEILNQEIQASNGDLLDYASLLNVRGIY